MFTLFHSTGLTPCQIIKIKSDNDSLGLPYIARLDSAPSLLVINSSEMIFYRMAKTILRFECSNVCGAMVRVYVDLGLGGKLDLLPFRFAVIFKELSINFFTVPTTNNPREYRI